MLNEEPNPRPEREGMVSFLRPPPALRRLFRNAGILISGNIVHSAIGLVVVSLLTRALSLETFGVYALVTAYIALINRLSNFQTWKALIHYGAHARERGDNSLMLSLMTFGWTLDVIGGVLGFGAALLGALLVPHWFGLGPDAMILTAVMGTTLLFNWISAPTAFMRLYDRFISQALYQVITSFLQLVAVSILWVSGEKSLLPYLMVAAACGSFGPLLFFVLAAREVQRRGVLKWSNVSLRDLPSKCPGIWRFVFTTNADGIVRVLRDLDIFLVNGLLGTAAAGLYKIARVLTRALGQLTGPFFQAIYPELAKLMAAGKKSEVAKLMRQSSASAGLAVGCAWVGFVLLGPYLLPLVFSPKYFEAYPVAIWSMAGMVVWAFALPLSPAMLALRMPGTSMLVHLVTATIYIGVLYACIAGFGLAGSGMAFLIFHLTWSLAMLFLVIRRLRTY